MAYIHRRFLVSAKSLLNDDVDSANLNARWWRMPHSADYVWRNLAYHLQESEDWAALAALNSDLRWARARIKRDGPVRAESDLIAHDPRVEALKTIIASNAHLLVPIDNSLDETSPILNAIIGIPEFVDASNYLIEEREAGCLVRRWARLQSATTVARIFVGHTDRIADLALCGDEQLASVSGDGTIKVWDPKSGSARQTLSVDGGWVSSLASAPDGTWIASGGYGRVIHVWDPSTGELLNSLAGHKDAIYAMAAFPDSRHLVTGSADGTTRIWNTRDGKCQIIHGRLTPRIWAARVYSRFKKETIYSRVSNAVAISRDGQRILIGDWEGKVHIFDCVTKEIVGIFDGHTKLRAPVTGNWAGPVESIAISSDGKWAVSSTSNIGTVLVWDLETASTRFRLQHGKLERQHGVDSVAISVDDSLIVTGGRDAVARLWDGQTGASRGRLIGHTANVSAVVVSPNGEHIFTGAADDTIRLWDVELSTHGEDEDDHGEGTIIFLPSGLYLIAADTQGTLQLLNSTSGDVLRKLGGNRGGIRDIKYIESRGLIVALGWSRNAGVWQVDSGTLVRVLYGELDSLDTHSRWVVAGCWDGTVKIWDLSDGTEPRVRIGHEGRVGAISISPDGSWFASGGHDHQVCIWDSTTGKLLKRLVAHSRWVNRLAISSSGAWLVSASDDGTVRVWSTSDWALLHALDGHESMVRAIEISRDDRIIVTGGWDGEVRVWDAEDGRLLQSLKGHTGIVASVAISEDGALVATASWDQTVRVWDVASGACVAGLRLDGYATKCQWQPNSSALAVVSRSSIHLWNYLDARDLISQPSSEASN
ncbi:hypothetical protein [Streptosporangium longisporum]|uniref:hypothetical protein n=1 Tax=Streptosporangium longisporum TaxID=46187 RepID=UPI0031F09BE3